MKSKVSIYYLTLSLILLSFEITSTQFVPEVVVVGRGGSGGGKCMVKEREALLHFKAHIVEDSRGLLFTWRPEEEEDNCCQWTGITCDSQTGHVTQLVLFNGGLKGEISPSLLNLTYLNRLELPLSSFNGSIPSFIGSMTQLTRLDLSGNQFNGNIPSFIGSMTQLTHLYLNNNSFSGNIPLFIGSLAQLRYLDLSRNSFNGTFPPELGNLTNLKSLSLGDLEGCTVENLEWLSHLSNLQELEMSGTSLAKADQWVNVISSLPKLSHLSLERCELSQVLHPYSSSLSSSSSSSIVTLDLSLNNLNSFMHHWLFPLTSNTLEMLDLTGNMLDAIPNYLGNLCNLTRLSIDNNSIAVKFPDLLNNLSGCTSVSLRTLYASHNRLTGSLSDEIQMFSSLEYLELDDNQLNGTLSEKVWELPKLQTLNLSSNSLSDAISNNIGNSKLPYASSIDMSSCKLGPRFPKWIQALTPTNLNWFDISNNRISDTVPLEFWNVWPSQLTYLNLSSNNFSGRVPDLVSNFNPLASLIDLSFNNFSGPIPNVSATLGILNLSKNRFSGGISFLCHIADGFLTFLDLSHNSLTGPIPDCLWHLKNLIVLNLGHNNLFGRLPNSVESLFTLEGLF